MKLILTALVISTPIIILGVIMGGSSDNGCSAYARYIDGYEQCIAHPQCTLSSIELSWLRHDQKQYSKKNCASR